MRIDGKVKLPAGVSAASGCKGTVTIRVKLGARTVATREASVTPRCTYSRSMIRAGAGKRTITATFGGNLSLLRRSSRTITIG
jgi:hypothetical protein